MELLNQQKNLTACVSYSEGSQDSMDHHIDLFNIYQKALEFLKNK